MCIRDRPDGVDAVVGRPHLLPRRLPQPRVHDVPLGVVVADVQTRLAPYHRGRRCAATGHDDRCRWPGRAAAGERERIAYGGGASSFSKCLKPSRSGTVIVIVLSTLTY